MKAPFLRLAILAAVGPLWTLGHNPADSAEIARLSAENWESFAPQGKEVDAIYGDLVLRNGEITAVIAKPLSTRNANMTVRDVGGCVIDLTRSAAPNDQLSAFYPGGGQFRFHDPSRVSVTVDGKPQDLGEGTLRGKVIQLRIAATAGPCQAVVTYEIDDRHDYLLVQTSYVNATKEDSLLSLHDSVRADRTFKFGSEKSRGLFWAVDDWFRQAYGIQVIDGEISQSGSRGIVVRYADKSITLPPQGKRELQRRLLVHDNLIAVRGQARRLRGEDVSDIKLTVRDPSGPVAHALIEAFAGGSEEAFAAARTSGSGAVNLPLPHGTWRLLIQAQGRPKSQINLEVTKDDEVEAMLGPCGYVQAEITDEMGRACPCKVAFHGIDGTANPYYGPDSAAYGVMNAQYTANGKFRAEIAPGRYEALISRGPEFDLVTKTIEVAAGGTTKISAQLKRTVDTSGWVSSDFHSHSSPSGDNTGSQRGRVLNLLAEHVEFAPCTEHNRISSYIPHLLELDAAAFMGTCSGMELTGNPLPINHQNAFPLKHTPRTQDGGGPTTHANPVAQIERLAMWDDKSDKLVQTNHPNLAQIVGDKDQNGEFDGGFNGMLKFMDVMEIHPLSGIFTPPEADPAGRKSRNPAFRWMQMLNLGYRIPATINTDAHYNYHESGWRRNYLASKTDDPAQIKTSDIVKAAEAGHVVMTTGPFLEVSMSADGKTALPGDNLLVKGSDGEASLRIRVQCSNWLDINRVQVFINGKPSEEHNFTRRTHPKQFTDQTVKYDRRISLDFEEDAHVIVAVIGEGLSLGRVMGRGRRRIHAQRGSAGSPVAPRSRACTRPPAQAPSGGATPSFVPARIVSRRSNHTDLD